MAADLSLQAFFSGDFCEPTDYKSHLRRCLLVGPSGSGKTGLLFQYALNRAQLGHSTLYVHCGSRDQLVARPPPRPFLSHPHISGSRDPGGQERSVLERRLLQMIHVKYAETWSQLRELFAELHLPEACPSWASRLPSTLIIDNIFSLSPAADALSPSPHKSLPCTSTRHSALLLALAAHAADALDTAIGAPAPSAHEMHSAGLDATRYGIATGQARAADLIASDASCTGYEDNSSRERAVLLIACTAPGPEAELATRWCETIVRISALEQQQSAIASKRSMFSIRAYSGLMDEAFACAEYAFDGPHANSVNSTLCVASMSNDTELAHIPARF